MRHIMMFFLILASASALASTGQQRAEIAGRSLVGSPAPRMTLTTIDGATIDLANLYGKQAVYLKFWATWCAPCREQMPHFERTFREAGPDLAVIAINLGFDDTPDQIRAYRREHGLTMPIVIDDGQLSEALHVRVTPQHVVIGRDGRIQYVGHLADARLEAALQAARTPAEPPAEHVAESATASIPEVSADLPTLTVTTLEDLPFPLRDPTARRPTVLIFLSPWCESYFATTRPASAAACRAVREQVDAWGRDRHVRWLGIASGLWAERDDLHSYRDEHRIAIPLTLDDSGALFRAFRVARVPTVVIADTEGRVVRRFEGDDPRLASELQALSVP